MLTKQQALKLRNALSVANKGSTKILSAITASKTGKITASAHKQYSKELRLIKSIAAKSERHLLKAFSNTQDLLKASKIEAVEKLLVASAELSLRAKLMSQVLADADELSELPDGPADFDADETEEIVEAEDNTDKEVEADDDETDEVEADDEEIECDDETDEVEADDDEEIVESDDDEETPVEAKRKALARAKALKARKAVKAKRVIPTRKRISANAKMVRSASVKRTSLAQANKSLIGWDFGVK